jgi:hypothetical protein
MLVLMGRGFDAATFGRDVAAAKAGPAELGVPRTRMLHVLDGAS